MLCITLGGGALYLPVVALKEIAAEFGGHRAVPSFAYMLGFFAMGLGSVFMGWLADRTSPRVPLLIDGEPAGGFTTQLGFISFISWSGLDIGRDRGSPVSHYEAPFEFSGRLSKVTVTMRDDQKLDGEAVGNAQMARQ